MMKEFEGIDIKEVWNYRLSTAVPQIDRSGGTWVVNIYSKSNPDYVPGQAPAQPLESYDTGIKAEPNDAFDVEKVKVCYEYLYGVRDKYARDDIEELKPAVAEIEKLQAMLAAKGAV